MVTEKDINKITDLVKLSFSDSEVQKLKIEIQELLQYFMDKLPSDTENIEPMEHIFHIPNVFREDHWGDSINRDELLKNAPMNENGCFTVPKVMDGI